LRSKYLSDTDIEQIAVWVAQIDKVKIKLGEEKIDTTNKATSIMQLNYHIIGGGKHRIVFDLNNEYVLKVAISEWGLLSNENEFVFYHHCTDHLRKYLCPAVELGRGWLIMKKMLIKVPEDEESHKKLSLLEAKFVENGIIPGDVRRKKVKPGGIKRGNLALSDEGEIVIIDYGNFSYGNHGI
jgi:hypothetical protein